MSQASGLVLETPVQTGECIWPWGENRDRWAACSGEQDEKAQQTRGKGERSDQKEPEVKRPS